METLDEVWRRFAENECGTYSPLYASICRSVADDPELLELVVAAPPSGRQPNVLLAAVHDVVLSGLAPALGEVYSGRAEPGRAPALFREVCLTQRDRIVRLLETRHTQTNEPGRAALLAIGLGVIADMMGEPIGLLDAGCSAGLNLLIDRYRFEYGEGRGLGPVDSPVTIACELRGAAPVPARLPTIAGRLGLDRAPVALGAEGDARWLLACVWPDTGRLARTAAAVDLARRHPPRLLAGDMVTDLDAALDRFDRDMPLVVVTTSACGYLTVDQRRAFLATVERRARGRPLAWLSTDAPGVVEAVPVPPGIQRAGPSGAVMGLVTFESGTVVGRALGLCHAHGAWLEWATSG